jgi:hypothetical protein
LNPIYLAPLKFSYPQYLLNGEKIGKNKHIMRIKTLKMEGGRPLQNPKIKNSKFARTHM